MQEKSGAVRGWCGGEGGYARGICRNVWPCLVWIRSQTVLVSSMHSTHDTPAGCKYCLVCRLVCCILLVGCKDLQGLAAQQVTQMLQNAYVCLCIQLSMYASVCPCVCMGACLFMHLSVHACICAYVCLCMCTSLHAPVCACVHLCMRLSLHAGCSRAADNRQAE